MTTDTPSLSFLDVQRALETIKSKVHRTMVLQCQTLNQISGTQLYFKCENFQKIGAFKFRGACNAVFHLNDQDANQGVVTHSSGNHAQALALAAKMRGIAAHIVMPSNAPRVKKDAVVGYGAHVVECEPTLEARETTAKSIQDKTGATFIHPYNHPHVIAGQGTAALELIKEVGDLDFVIAPIGGGGLMSGTCLTVKELCPNAKIIGAEPDGADDAARSKAAGQLIPQTNPNTIADGLLTSLGSLTWPFVRDQVDEIVTTSEGEIVAAMKLFWSRTKVIIEPSSATTVAVAMKYDWPQGSKVGIILSGGNVDLDRLPWVN